MTAHRDRYEPKLRVRASGLGGSGYAIPTRPVEKDGKPLIVPGATTVTGVERADGITQWAVDNTAAYAVEMADRLLDKSKNQGFNMLRWYHHRKPDPDDPTVDLTNYSNGVLSDLADFGTWIHDYIADSLFDRPTEDPPTEAHYSAIEAFEIWASEHVIEPIATEITVFNPEHGYAGTLDHIISVDFEPMLLDVKTSRNINGGHLKQLSCLGAADVWMREDPARGAAYETRKWGTTYWSEDVVPSFSSYGILQVRPDDYDKNGKPVPAFAELHRVPQEIVDASFDGFLGALAMRKSNKVVKDIAKSLDFQYLS